MITKTCTKCKENLSAEHFNIRLPQGTLKSWCKKCNSLRNMQRSYSLSPDDYDVLLKNQDHKCLVCGQHEDHVPARGNLYRKLCVDHSHTTGNVRGLLCHNCNVMLGHAKDDPTLLVRAIAYLNDHKGK